MANSFSYEAQYRGDTWIKMFFNIIWLASMFLTVEVVFRHTSALAGWDKGEIYLMTLFWILADELAMMIFGANLPQLPDTITDGKLDIYLTKPMSALFAISTKIFLVRSLYRFIMEIIILAAVIWKFDFAFNLLYVFFSILLGLAGIFVLYSFTLMLNTLAFWLHRIDNVNVAISVLTSLGKYPVEVLPRTMRILAFTAIPIAFTAYIPVAALTGRSSWHGILYALVFAGLFFWGAVKFWNFALKRYSSASS